MGNSFKVSENSTSAAGISPCSRGSSRKKVKAPCSNSSKVNRKANPKHRIYTFKELEIATNYFKSDNFVGIGSFGKMYKGWVDEETLKPAKNGQGMAVAVKACMARSSWRANKLQREVDILGRISHPNLIKLFGHCSEHGKLLLVYEFMANGNLDNHLFNNGAREPPSWEQRMKIAVGAARALAFLHAPENNIIHRDFKPSHILLDSAFNPKLSGLALAIDGPAEADSHVDSTIVGTIGYLAPEYVVTGHPSSKVDVFAFGVVLLQLLSGKKARYAVACLSDHLMFDQLMDPRLENEYPVEAALRAGQLAVQCVLKDPASRPSMNEVVGILEQIDSDGSSKRN